MKIVIAAALSLISQISIASEQFVPVLMYHRVDNTVAPGATVISKDNFRKHIKFLKENGYSTITMEELTEYLNGKINLPQKTVAITLDDGWKSFIDAGKILNDYDSKATFYVLSGVFDYRDYLTESELVQLSKNRNFEIGAHSHTHFMEWITDLSKIDLRIMVGEIAMSKAVIEKTIGKPITTFAWPFGYTRPEALEYTKTLGFTSTAMVNSSAKNSIGVSPFEIRRINIDGNCTIADLRSMVETGNLEECKHDESIKKADR